MPDGERAILRFRTRLAPQFIRDLQALGAFVLAAPIGDARPARLTISTGEGTAALDVYLWTVTGHQEHRPADEYRIQGTNAGSIALVPGCTPIVGGWNIKHEVWVFWNPYQHLKMRASNSCQVKEHALEQAKADGFGFYRKPDEIVAICRKDYLLWYVTNAASIHPAADAVVSPKEEVEEVDPATLAQADLREYLSEATTDEEAIRRFRVVQNVQAIRDSRFRVKVLEAYNNRCAVCQTGLRLVDAAHIIPVAVSGGSDSVRNGLALCRLHHGAYDNALLGVLPDFSIVVNDRQAASLTANGYDSGLDAFKHALPQLIETPTQADLRPSPNNLIRGLEVRLWPADVLAAFV